MKRILLNIVTMWSDGWENNLAVINRYAIINKVGGKTERVSVGS